MSKKEIETKRIKKPWPTKDAMEQIYEMNLWGDNRSEFYSGVGSHQPAIVDPYIEVVCSFLTSFDAPIVVCDLGCGDFNVGNKLVKYALKYVAADIAEDLIESNKKLFNEDNLEFRCLDIATDELPFGDCAIVRQVLQHVSNSEIQRILPKLAKFRYVIVTEHIPEGDFKANVDIISGQGTRLKKQSGVDLLASPFELKVKEEKILLSQQSEDGNGLIVTTLYNMI